MSISDLLLSISLMPIWISYINNTIYEYTHTFNNLVGIALPILQLTAIFVCLYLLILLICWMFGFIYNGVIILPFDNATQNSNYNGKGISDLLLSEMRRIHELHSEKFDLRTKSEAKIPKRVKYGMNQFSIERSSDSPRLQTESLSRNIANMGTIGSSGNMVSIGHLLLILKRLCPLGNVGSVITGSIQKYDNEFFLIAHLETHDVAKTWRVSDTLENDAHVPTLVKDLALKIYKDIATQCNVQTCDGLRHIIDALDSYERYSHHREEKYLNSCYNNCIHALSYEKGHFYLFKLCYQIGLDYLNRGMFEKSREILSQAVIEKDNIDTSSNCPVPRTFSKPIKFFAEVDAQCKRRIFYEYAKAWNMLGIAQENLDLNSDAYESYNKSIDLDIHYWAPYYNLGRICSKLGKNENIIIDLYSNALKLEPKMPMIYVSLASIYKKINKNSKYKESCKNAGKYIANEEEYNQACFKVVCEESYSTKDVISLLDLALSNHQVSLKWVISDPDLGSLSGCKDFLDLVKLQQCTPLQAGGASEASPHESGTK